MGKRKNPAWRDHAAADLLMNAYERGLAGRRSGPVLLVEASLASTAARLRSLDVDICTWNRRMGPVGRASPWPEQGPFSGAVVRLPKGVDELVMTAHAVRSCLEPAGPILLYGAKDEGIESAPRRVEDVWGQARKVAVGGHCRVLEFSPESAAPERGSHLAHWKSRHPTPVAGLGGEWVSYPGVFGHRLLAAGHLDPGTHALLDALPTPPPGVRALDYGCGSGMVAAWMRHLRPDCRVELVDIDAVALEAARDNVPGAEAHLHDRVPAGSWDWIVGNPPYHQGKAHTLDVLERLIMDSASALGPSGRLVFVTQRRLPVERHLEGRFRTVRVLLDRGPFRIWSAQRPRSGP